MKRMVVGLICGLLMGAGSAGAAVKYNRLLHIGDTTDYSGIHCKAGKSGAMMCFSHNGFGYAISLSRSAVIVLDGDGSAVFEDLNYDSRY